MPVITVLGLNSGGAAPPAAFNHTDLYPGSETGAAYLPADETSVFSQALKYAGGPATVGGLVGFVADKARIPGTVADFLAGQTEQLTNNDLASATGWTTSSGVSIGSGAAAFDGSNASATLTQVGAISTSLEWYYCVVTVANYVSGTARIVLGGHANSVSQYSINGNGTFTFIYPAQTTGTSDFVIQSNSGSAFFGDITNIELKLLPGDHAYSSSTGVRGTLRQDGALTHYVEFNGSQYLASLTIPYSPTTAVLFAVKATGTSENKWSGMLAWSNSDSWNFAQGNPAETTLYASWFAPGGTATATFTDAGADTALRVWDLLINDTTNTVTIYKDGVEVLAATSFTANFGTSGGWRIGTNFNFSRATVCDFYGMIAYEQSALNSDARQYLSDMVGGAV